jgi:hypothetical protein
MVNPPDLPGDEKLTKPVYQHGDSHVDFVGASPRKVDQEVPGQDVRGVVLGLGIPETKAASWRAANAW